MNIRHLYELVKQITSNNNLNVDLNKFKWF